MQAWCHYANDVVKCWDIQDNNFAQQDFQCFKQANFVELFEKKLKFFSKFLINNFFVFNRPTTTRIYLFNSFESKFLKNIILHPVITIIIIIIIILIIITTINTQVKKLFLSDMTLLCNNIIIIITIITITTINTTITTINIQVKKLFLSDMTLLCNNNRENRRTVLQMSVWQVAIFCYVVLHYNVMLWNVMGILYHHTVSLADIVL